jgi:hypothetical protein
MRLFGSRRSGAWLCASALSFSALFAAPANAAGAKVKQACVAAADKGQELRSDGKLTLAREQFVRCSKDECPAPLRQDCAQWMTEVVSALPSVVVGARDAEGHDLVQVRVIVDGSAVAESLDGKPIPVDPGVHRFRYELADGRQVEDRVVVRQGEKNRALTVTFLSLGGAPPATAGRPGEPAPKARRTEGGTPSAASTSPPAMAWLLGGVGLVALGTAAYFDLSANSRVLDLRSSCAPNCEQSDVDAVRTKYTVAGVAAGVGVVSLGIASYLFLRHPSEPERVGRLRVDLGPTPGGASAALSAAF